MNCPVCLSYPCVCSSIYGGYGTYGLGGLGYGGYGGYGYSTSYPIGGMVTPGLIGSSYGGICPYCGFSAGMCACGTGTYGYSTYY